MKIKTEDGNLTPRQIAAMTIRDKLFNIQEFSGREQYTDKQIERIASQFQKLIKPLEKRVNKILERIGQ